MQTKGQENDEIVEIGQRIQSTEGFKGTVRYFGPVVGQKGNWIGIEWDDKTRGKHDGVTGGTKYFSCSLGAGSFVRRHKISTGISILEAMKQRYQVNNNGTGSPEQKGVNYHRVSKLTNFYLFSLISLQIQCTLCLPGENFWKLSWWEQRKSLKSEKISKF